MRSLFVVRWAVLLGVLFLVAEGALGAPSSAYLSADAPPSSEASAAAPDHFGIDHVSAIDGQIATVSALRYQQSAAAGAAWNRWVFYWQDIESSQGRPNYAPQDAVVSQDVANGFRYKIDAVLMGTPAWAADGAAALSADRAAPEAPAPRVGQRSYPSDAQASITATGCPSSATYPPQNLAEPVFGDGTDLPGTGKAVNPANYWARFVFDTVSRYKNDIRHWEIWNEPDYLPSAGSGWYGFWCGSADRYFRLLKVAYLAAKSADPNAVIVMGGMAYWPEIVQLKRAPFTFFSRVLALATTDPQGASNRNFFDVTAWHWYNRSNQHYYKVRDTQAALARYGLGAKPIWINESGMPVWNDPPGRGQPYFGSGTMTEQASYVMQALAFGLAAGVERQFVFQEYDDGNAEAFGLIRNSGAGRPAYNAYGIASRYLKGTYSAGLSAQGTASIVTAYTSEGNRVYLLWNNAPGNLSVALPARSPSALLWRQPTEASPLGTQQTAYPIDGLYQIALSGATNSNGVTAADYIVGGPVVLLVEGGQSLPAPVVPPTGLVYNGGFELPPDFGGWTLTGYVPARLDVTARSGKAAAVLGAEYKKQPELPGANSTLSQILNLPNAGDLKLKLSYLLRIQDAAAGPPGGPCPGDRLEVLLFESVPGAGSVRHDVLIDCSVKLAWTDVTLDLNAYRGKQVTLTFNVWQDDLTISHPTTAYLDDIRLWPFQNTLPNVRR